MNLFVPDGYKLIAKTEMTGNTVKCYYNPNNYKIFFLLEYLEYEHEPKYKWLSFGPFPKTSLESIALTMKDVIEMTTPTYIEDK